jgi:Family of unknown function (DUF6152)
MKTGRLLSSCLIVALLAMPGFVFAHHGQVEYENKTISLKGTVTKFEWNNPHAILWLDVKNEKNTIDAWHLEILPLERMSRAGWTRDSVKPGDEVTVTGRPGKGGEHIMWLESLMTADGRRLGRDSERR